MPLWVNPAIKVRMKLIDSRNLTPIFQLSWETLKYFADLFAELFEIVAAASGVTNLSTLICRQNMNWSVIDNDRLRGDLNYI